MTVQELIEELKKLEGESLMRRISIYAYPSGDRIADTITIEDDLTFDEIDKKVIEAIMEHIEYGWYVSFPEEEDEENK